MTYSVTDLIGEKLEQIWLKPEYETIHKSVAPYIPKTIETQGLLFIGLNPSEDRKEKPTKGSKPRFLDDRYHYYAKFPVIAEAVELPWSHIDLLFFRQTNQTEVESICKFPDNPELPSTSFITDQLFLADFLIETAKPKIIIVNNTLARTLLGYPNGHWLRKRFKFDDRLGTHRSLEYDTPVFFTSMLTGQRALDRGSFERLIWHIKFVLKQIE